MDDLHAEASVIVEEVHVPAWVHDLVINRTTQPGLLILPERVREGRGEYRADSLPVFRALRKRGVNIDWAHPASGRTFISTYGADAAIAITLFIVQTLSQQALNEIVQSLRIWMRGVDLGPKTPPASIQIDHLKVTENGLEIEGLKITGRDEKVIDSVEGIIRAYTLPKRTGTS